MESKKIEDVKAEIRSILLTFQGGTSLQELLNTYKSLIGQTLPTCALGYSSDIDLLKSMPDVLRISVDNQGQCWLFGIADEKTKHIQNLVKKQKKRKSTDSETSTFDEASKSSALMDKCDQPSDLKSAVFGSEYNQETFKNSQEHQSVPANEELYKDVKIEIRSTLLPFHNGISLEGFLKSYQTFVGRRLPTRALGYMSPMDLLESMPDVVHISPDRKGNYHLCGIADAATKHIQRLVSRQKHRKPIFNVKKKIYHSAESCSLKNHSSQQLPFVSAVLKSEVTCVMKEYPNGITLPLFLQAYQKMFEKTVENVNCLEDLEKIISIVPGLQIKGRKNQKRVLYSCDSKNPFHVLDKSGISEEVKSKFLKVLNEHPYGLMAQYFPEEYKKITGDSFDLHAFGYVSILQLTNALPDIFSRKSIPGNTMQWKLYPAGAEKASEHKEQSSPEFCSKNEAYDANELKRKIENLVHSYDKIEFRSLPMLYKLLYQEHLPICDAELETFIEDIAGEISIRFLGEKGSETLWLVKQLTSEINSSVDQETLPEDAVPLSSKYGKQEIPETVDGHLGLIFVSAILDPTNFWFQLLTEDGDKQPLEELENEMQAFYNGSLGNKYELKVADIKIGAPCVVMCPDDQQWYRALIKSRPSHDVVDVEFVDYGMSQHIDNSKLRYIRSEYCLLPSQAFKGSLARIRPSNDNLSWDNGSITRFIELCNCSSMAAQLKSKENDVYSLFLHYNNGEENVFVNLQLSKEGFAVIFCEDASTSESHCKLSDDNSSEAAFYSGTCSEDFSSDEESSDKSERLSEDQLELDDSREPTPVVLERTYVKRVNLIDGGKIHIIVIKNEPFMSAGDICSLLWNDKDADILDEQLNESMFPALNLRYEVEEEDLFKDCHRLKVKGFKEINGEEYLKLYRLAHVIPILNVFGYPSVEVRSCIAREVRGFDPYANIESVSYFEAAAEADDTVDLNNAHGLYLLYDDLIVEDSGEVKERAGLSQTLFKKLCAFDLKKLKESFHSTRLFLMKLSQYGIFGKNLEMKKLDHLIEIIDKRIKYIENLCR